MIRLTLAQMRAGLGRLAAAGIAILLGTAFVAATLLAGDLIDRTGRDAVTAQYGQADLVVRPDDVVTSGLVAQVLAAPGVTAADPVVTSWTEISGPDASIDQTVTAVPSDPRLGTLTVVEGRAPAADDEIALPADSLSRLDVQVGGTVTVGWYPMVSSSDVVPTAEATATVEPTEGSEAAVAGTEADDGRDHVTVVVVGVVADPTGAWSSYGGSALATFDSTVRWTGATDLADAGASSVLVVTVQGESAQAQESLSAELPDAQVLTRAQAAQRAYEQMGSDGNVLVAVVMAFAAVALLVAALVIANTFTVLVAQRARRLALLRCVGATRGQLRRSVLLEATILGVAASAVGLVVGIGLAQVALSVLRSTVSTPLPATVHVGWTVVVVPLALGTLVTVLASLVPARLATRVSPMEALRPLDVPATGSKAGRVRLAFSLLLGVGGLLGLLGAVGLSRVEGAGMAPLGIGVLTGATAFVGLLLGAVYWVPPVVRLAGRVAAATGPVGRLAAVNTSRNPRRTAATSTALLIGVTLVVMMSTGAASARASMDRELDEQYSVDLAAVGSDYTPDGSPSALPADAAADVERVDGVAEVAQVRTATLTTAEGDVRTVTAIDPADAARVLRDQGTAGRLVDGVVLTPSTGPMPPETTLQATVVDEQDGSVSPTGAAVPVRTEPVDAGSLTLTSTATLAEIAPDAPVTTLFVRLDAGADPIQVLRDVQDAVGGEQIWVTSPAAERAQLDQVIDVMLAIVLGLLGVSVVIAVLGVANTLSLSVLERRRESATLRAIGLSRRRLRRTLAVEGVLIAVVGAVLGTALGLLFGWAGSATVFGTIGQSAIAVPWRDLGVVLVVAVAAGLLASLLPARAAARTSPVAALGVE